LLGDLDVLDRAVVPPEPANARETEHHPAPANGPAASVDPSAVFSRKTTMPARSPASGRIGST
jgi:hypothetical protein